jgi:cytosine/uracil/thiamine/allantoin permease
VLTRLSELMGGIPTSAVVALLVLFVVQVALQVYGLCDLVKRRAVPGGRKWIWAVVIVAGNLVGAVLYLALGRSAPPPSDQAADRGAGDAAARERAIDRLYGDRR